MTKSRIYSSLHGGLALCICQMGVFSTVMTAYLIKGNILRHYSFEAFIEQSSMVETSSLLLLSSRDNLQLYPDNRHSIIGSTTDNVAYAARSSATLTRKSSLD